MWAYEGLNPLIELVLLIISPVILYLGWKTMSRGMKIYGIIMILFLIILFFLNYI